MNASELRLRPSGAFPATLGAAVACLALYLLGYGAFGVLAAALAAALAGAALATGLAARGLEVAPLGPAQGVAGRELLIPLKVSNKGRFAARDVCVECEPASRRPRHALAALLRPRSSADLRVPARFPDRGRRRQLDFVVHTSFPLGLFRVRLATTLEVDVVVWPRMGHMRALDELMAQAAGRLAPARRGPSGEGEFFALREWREGESLRSVHWKHSARRGRRMLREVRAEDRPTVRVALAVGVDLNALGGRLARRPPAFERAVSLVATLTRELLQRGHRVRFELHAPLLRRATLERGPAALRGVLDLLAEVEAEPGWSAAAPRPTRREGSAMIVVTAGVALPACPGRVVIDASAQTSEELYRPVRRRSAAPASEQDTAPSTPAEVRA